MEVAVPLVVGGLAGFSVATACGAEPRVPQCRRRSWRVRRSRRWQRGCRVSWWKTIC